MAEEEGFDLWTRFLELTSQLVMPDWNALILLLPFAFFGLVGLILLPVVRAWRRAGARNRSRVPARRAPVTPEGIHMPGPSIWPFIAPVAAALILAALVFPAGGLPVNPILLAAGLGAGALAAGGWMWDAGREWRRTQAGAQGGHGAHEAALAPGGTVALVGPGSGALEIPEGIHLPGPSPWPFFVPIAGFVILAGLIFGPILIVAGIVMGLLALAGWYRDAGREYVQVEAGHLPEPTSRDPVRVFPVSLLRVYGAIAVVALVLTVAPTILGSLPGNAPDGGGGPAPSAEPPDPEPELSASSALSFDKDRLVVPADQPLRLTFDNQQAGVPHDVAIRVNDEALFDGEEITGPAQIVYDVPPLAAGEYTFLCTIHPPMNGVVVAQ